MNKAKRDWSSNMEPFDHNERGHFSQYNESNRYFLNSEEPTVYIPPLSRGSQISGKPSSVFQWLVSWRVFTLYLILLIVIVSIDAAYTYVRTNSCSPVSNKRVTVNGSIDFAPFVQDIARGYQKKCLGASISVNASNLPQDSLNGLQQVEKGTIDIGTSDVFADPYQNPGLNDYQVGVVIFALVVNNDVDITNLTTEQMIRIYSGDITNWQSIGGKQSLNIILISRPPSSIIRVAFERYLLGGIETVSGPQSLISDTSDSIAQAIQEQPGAIGYVPLYYAKKYNLKVISIDNNSPLNEISVEKNVYPFWDIEHMYTKGAPEGTVKDFIEHMFSSDVRQLLKQDGYLSIDDFSRNVLLIHVSKE